MSIRRSNSDPPSVRTRTFQCSNQPDPTDEQSWCGHEITARKARNFTGYCPVCERLTRYVEV